MDYRRQSGGKSPFKRWQKLCCFFDGFAVATKSARVRGEIWILQCRCDNPARKFSLLVHSDGAEHAIVDQHDDNRQAILNSSRKLLSIHKKIAVSGKANDGPIREHSRRADRCRKAKAHRAGGGSDLLLNSTKAQKAADPDGEVAGAGREDRIRRPATQSEHDFAELNLAWVWRRLLAPGQIIDRAC